MSQRELFLPNGDTHTAPIEAMERVLGELPLDGCVVRRSDFADGLEYVAPPGKAFRITGPGLSVGRLKEYWIGSRHEADGHLPQDPLAVDESDRFESGVIPEHVAPILAIEAQAPGFYGYRSTENEDGWTTYPQNATSDDVQVNVSLRDHPQAWTWIPHTGVAFPANNNPLSKAKAVVFPNAENRQFAYRQATITGAADKVMVELVDVDYAALNADGRVRSPDGRELQIAGSPVQGDGTVDLPFNTMTAIERDEWHMRLPEAYTLGHLPEEVRLPILWNGNRDRIVGDHFRRQMFGAFYDDPLRDFDIVYADPQTGKVADIERLIEVVEETAELSRLSYGEAEKRDDDAEKNPDPQLYRRHGKTVLEVIPSQGSLSAAIANYCGEDWELATGQRGADPTLFGWFNFPDRITQFRAFVTEHSMEEVIEKYASDDWRIQERKEWRQTVKPRDMDQYLGVLTRCYEQETVDFDESLEEDVPF